MARTTKTLQSLRLQMLSRSAHPHVADLLIRSSGRDVGRKAGIAATASITTPDRAVFAATVLYAYLTHDEGQHASKEQCGRNDGQDNPIHLQSAQAAGLDAELESELLLVSLPPT